MADAKLVGGGKGRTREKCGHKEKDCGCHADQVTIFGDGSKDDPFHTYIGCKPFEQETITIYVRTNGRDTGGNRGTLARPYRTFQRAVCDVPNPIPPGYTYFIDITGITEVLPDDYALPAWKAPYLLRFDDFAPFGVYTMAVNIKADPRIMPLTPPSAATIAMGDVFSIVADPVSTLITVTLNLPARPSYAGNALKGQFLKTAVDGLELSVIYESTENLGVGGRSTISIVNSLIPTAPFTILERTAWLSGSQATSNGGTLAALNCDSLSITGIKITSNNGGTGLQMRGSTASVIQDCELENPDIEMNDVSLSTRYVKNWTYGFQFYAGEIYFIRCLQDNCEQNVFTPSNVFFREMVFDTCTSVRTLGIGDPPNEVGAADSVVMVRSLIKNSLGDGFYFTGSQGALEDVDIYGCQGHGVRVDLGAGLLTMRNVRSSGAPNTGEGVFVDDGMFVAVDAATACPLISGAGISLAFATPTVTLTAAPGSFPTYMVGAKVVIGGATNPDNNGTFTVLTVNGPGSVLTYENLLGAAQGAGSTWTTTKPLDGVSGQGMQVGALPFRDWTDFDTLAPVGNQYDLVSMNAGATDQSTGSRLYKKF